MQKGDTMTIKTPKKMNIVSHPLLSADFSWADSLERRLNGFFDLYGPFQKTIDQTFMDNMMPYMPYDTGVLRETTVAATVIGSGMITSVAPYAQFLYYGLLMLDDRGSAWALHGGHKTEVNIPLRYHGGGPKASPMWDRNMWAEQGDTLLADWQRYVKQNF